MTDNTTKVDGVANQVSLLTSVVNLMLKILKDESWGERCPMMVKEMEAALKLVDGGLNKDGES